MAFEAIGGIPRALRYDNLRSVVLKREPLTYNPAFLEFARHYRFEIRLCNVRAGNEKGRVERLIRSLRDTFFNVSDHHQSEDGLNAALGGWVQEKNQTIHRATDAIPSEKKKEESLRPLPERRWQNVLVHAPKLPTKTGSMIFDTSFYSVPNYAAHESLTLHTSVDRVEIYNAGGQRVASHPRCFERKKEITNPLHRSANRLSDKAKRERIYHLIRNMDPVMERFLEQNRIAGEDPFQTAYVFFKLLKSESRGILLSLVREAVRKKDFRLKNLLAKVHSLPAAEPVSPQNASLLAIDYKPRSLEDYDVK
jgi:hypothetical protein